MSPESLNNLLADMRRQVEYSDKITMPISLYERMKAVIATMGVSELSASTGETVGSATRKDAGAETPANGTLIDYLAARGLVFILGIPPKSEDGTLLIWEGGCNARVAHWEGNKLIQWDDSEPIEINDIHSWMRLPHPSIWPFVAAPTELLPEADLYSAKTDVLTAFERQSS